MEKIDDLNKVIETLEDAERALKIARELERPSKNGASFNTNGSLLSKELSFFVDLMEKKRQSTLMLLKSIRLKKNI